MSSKNHAYINASLLKWARLETPFDSYEEVVEHISTIDINELRDWEEGNELPSITEAKALSKLYDIPFAALFLSDIPKKSEKIYIDRRTISGASIMPMSYKLWKEIRHLISCRENAIELLDKNDIITNIPLIDSNTSINSIAKIIRSSMNITTPFKNKSVYQGNSFSYFRNKLEAKGILVLQLSGISMHEIRGIALYYDELPIIAVNSMDSNNGKTFTLIHELAHLVRRTSALCMVNFNEQADEEEKICDKIAVETLIPQDTFGLLSPIKNHKGYLWTDFEITELADKYGVSKLVIIRRLFELSVIERSYYSKLYSEYSDDYEKNREQIKLARVGKEFKLPYFIKYLSNNGKLYPSIILSAHSDGRVSLGETCRILNIDVKHISKIEQAVMFR